MPQKHDNEDSYPRMIDGQVGIWPDLLLPAGQIRSDSGGENLNESHGGSGR